MCSLDAKLCYRWIKRDIQQSTEPIVKLAYEDKPVRINVYLKNNDIT